MLQIIATDLNRIMQCNGSFKLPVFETPQAPNSVREQGIAAHWVAQVIARKQFTDPVELVDRRAPNGVMITPDMTEHVGEYLDIVSMDTDEFNELEVETRLMNDAYVINGRADNVYVSDDGSLMKIRDFKYGFTIVEPDNNWTLIFHAISYAVNNNFWPQTVHFEIFQPRAYHHFGKLRRATMTGDELKAAWHMLHQTLSALSDHLQTGPECGKCKSFVYCPVRRQKDFNAIDAAGVAYADDLPNDALAVMLDTVTQAKKTLEETEKALLELTRHRVKSGQVVANYGFEPTLGNTTWNEGVNVAMMKALTGKDLSQPKLVTPAAAKRAGVPEAIVDAFTHRPITGHKLVREDINKKAARLLGAKT